ncbi:MAG: hypothetical protein L6Q57_04015 [Alphaproteobacteria bacterium]|nr:hypothetical protein [Alphaproteobacteria bacterium]
MVSNVTLGSAISGQDKTASSAQGLAKDFNEFLILLTTQLQNQDPLSPMETNEFTQQLIGFTQVEQQINLNSKLDAMVSLQLGNNMGAALNYVGKQISYVSSEMHFDGAEPVKITYAYNGQAAASKIRILDEAGKVVYEADASTAAGKNEFVWDGRTKDGAVAKSGTYQIKIDALDINKNGVTSTVVVTGRVRGVESQDGLMFLLVGDRAVSMGNVLNAADTGNSKTGDNLQDALAYVGKDVRFASNKVTYNGTDAVSVNYTLSAQATTGTIKVLDKSGATVYEGNIETAAGDHGFTWDGSGAAAGEYTVVVNAKDANGNSISNTITQIGHVNGAEVKNGVAYLFVGNQKLTFADILSVMEAA